MSPRSVPKLNGYQIYLPESLSAFERRVRPEPLPRLVYHYTDAAAAASIVHSGAMWATNVRFMNDETELIYATDLIGDIVRSEAITLNGLSREWLSRFEAMVRRSIATAMTFASSFCFDGDPQYHWSEYGHSDGVALGFDAATLSCLEDATIVAVQYNLETQHVGVRESIRIHREAFTRAVERKDRHRIVEVSGMLAFQLALWAAVIKNPKYHRELEWRLVPLVYDPAMVQTRPDGRPYIELSLRWPVGDRMPLRDVRRNPADETSPTVHVEALDEAGYDVPHILRGGPA